MSASSVLDVYVREKRVGTLSEGRGGAYVFTYLPDASDEDFVSLRMPVRPDSYNWTRGVHPIFLMNLPEGYQKDLLRAQLGPHADVSDIGLLALTGQHTIGRVRVFVHGQTPQSGVTDIQMARLLASPNSQEHLLKYLEQGVVDGVSGVMPKLLQQPKATTTVSSHILKTGLADLPGLAINEFLCLEVARRAKLRVPAAVLSDDGEVLAVQRFDRDPHGQPIGVEDFCAIQGLDPINKYKGSLEDIAKILTEYVPKPLFAETAKQLFKLLLVNYALRNADAHLKNFALTYTTYEDVMLAPVFDVVTVTAYPTYRDAIPGLTLGGKKAWHLGKQLHQYAATYLSLPKHAQAECLEEVTQAIAQVTPEIGKYASRYPAFRETGKWMLDAWEQGRQDIQPDATAKRKPSNQLRAASGLSEDKPVRRKANSYANPDGGFSHKAR